MGKRRKPQPPASRLPRCIKCDAPMTVAKVEPMQAEGKGLLQANAADHMEEVVARMQNVMEVAKAAAPFVHPKLATVDFVAPGEQHRMVVRVPEVAKSAEEWTQQNQRRLGLTEIELDPLKKPN